MNFKLLTQKAIDFILNLSVVAFGLAIFEESLLGLVIGGNGIIIAIALILNSKE